MLQLIITFKDPEPFVGTVVEHDGFKKNAAGLENVGEALSRSPCWRKCLLAGFNLPFYSRDERLYRTRYVVDTNDVMSKTSSTNFGSNFKIHLEKKNGCGSVASQTASFPSRVDDATNRNVRHDAQDRFIHRRRAFIGQAQVNPKHSGLHTIKTRHVCILCSISKWA